MWMVMSNDSLKAYKQMINDLWEKVGKDNGK